jgi:hypothetical protein
LRRGYRFGLSLECARAVNTEGPETDLTRWHIGPVSRSRSSNRTCRILASYVVHHIIMLCGA